MMGRMTVQRRSLCMWAGMAVGFRAFCAVIIDGGLLFGSAWIAMLAGLLFSIPVAAALIAVRRENPNETAVSALSASAGRWGSRMIGLIFFAVLVYDAGAVMSLMSSTAKYVAMPEANRNIIRAVTAVTAIAAALMGAAASANAAVLWRRLAAALIAVLVLTQAKYFRISWLTPWLGPGVGEIAKNALPAAGMFGFAAAGWLMLEPEHDRDGGAILKCVVHSGLVASVLSLMFCMLIPSILEEPPARSFRIGRLLVNDRAGLTLEMPYVVLLYSGMLTMLVFELNAAARAAQMLLPGISAKICVLAAGIPAFLLSVSKWVEREMLGSASMWYYPLIAIPICLAGLSAWVRLMKKRKRGGGGV